MKRVRLFLNYPKKVGSDFLRKRDGLQNRGVKLKNEGITYFHPYSIFILILPFQYSVSVCVLFIYIIFYQYSLPVCSCHVTFAFQSESTLYNCLNVKELLARSRHKIWRLSDCNWARTQNHLVHKWTLFWVRVQLQSLSIIYVFYH